MVIYKTTNLVNGKQYIGRDSRNNPNYLGSGVFLKRAINKYGKENFKKEIIEECSSFEELIEREEYWLIYCNAGDNPLFYNLQNCGKGVSLKGEKNPAYGKGYLFTGEKNHFYGKKHSVETREKIKQKRKLQVFSEESRRKVSETLRERAHRGEKNPMFGKTGELCQNFKGYVVCVDGHYKGERKTSKEWADIFGISISLVSMHLSGKRNKNGIKGNFLKWERDVG